MASITQTILPLLNWRPCVYKELQLSKWAAYGSNNVCPAAACGDRQTVLVSDSLLKRCCKIVNHLALHVTPYAYSPSSSCPVRQKLVFHVWPPSLILPLLHSCSILPLSFFLFLSLSTCPHLIITFLFNCLSFFSSQRWMQACQGNSRLQQSRQETALFLFLPFLYCVPDDVATKYYHHLVYFHKWIWFLPERPQTLLL